jgi:O-antigen/teichoic acid export membrane protein
VPVPASTPPTVEASGRFAVLSVVGLGLSTTCNFAVAAVVVRSLPPVQAGTYFVALSMVFLLGLFARAGADGAVLRTIASARSRGQAAVGRAFWSAMLLATTAAAVLALLLVAGPGRWIIGRLLGTPALVGVLLPLTIWLAGEGLRTVPTQGLWATGRVPAALAVGEPGRALVMLLFIGTTAATAGLSLHRTVWCAAAASATVTVAGLAAVARRLGRPALLRTEYVGAARVALPLLVTIVLASLTTQADVLVVAARLGTSDAASYAAAMRLSLALGLPLLGIAVVVAPLVARAVVLGDPKRIEPAVRSLTTLATAVTVVGALVIASVPHFLLRTAYSGGYASAAPLLVILCAGPVSTAVTGPNGIALMMAGRTALVSVTVLCVALLQISAMVLAAGAFGVTGVAVASSAGTVLQNVALMALCWRATGLLTLCRWTLNLRSLLDAARSTRT